MQLEGCATRARCESDTVLATSGMQVPPNQCYIDGCTLVPDFNFSECCNSHDMLYWKGGTKKERKKADLNFQQCIAEADHKALANLYYLGVRLGGSPYIPSSWRWGFGWNYPHGYDKPHPNKDKTNNR